MEDESTKAKLCENLYGCSSCKAVYINNEEAASCFNSHTKKKSSECKTLNPLEDILSKEEYLDEDSLLDLIPFHSNEDKESKGAWSKEVIRRLIEQVKLYRNEFLDKNTSQNVVWQNIFNELQVLIPNQTVDQVIQKWKDLERAYFDCNGVQKQSITSKAKWPDLFEDLAIIMKELYPSVPESEQETFTLEVIPQNEIEAIERGDSLQANGALEAQVPVPSYWTIEAISRLIELVKINYSRLTNPAVKKLSVWREIALDIMSLIPGVTVKQVEQKWVNLKQKYKTYMKCLRNEKNTRMKKPLFFEEIFSILEEHSQPVEVLIHEKEPEICLSVVENRSQETAVNQALKVDRRIFYPELWTRPAIEMLLDLVKENYKYLVDKYVSKCRIWQNITAQLKETLPQITKKQVQQKWINLRNKFKQYLLHMYVSGRKARMKRPTFYNKISTIISHKNVLFSRSQILDSGVIGTSKTRDRVAAMVPHLKFSLSEVEDLKRKQELSLERGRGIVQHMKRKQKRKSNADPQMGNRIQEPIDNVEELYPIKSLKMNNNYHRYSTSIDNEGNDTGTDFMDGNESHDEEDDDESDFDGRPLKRIRNHSNIDDNSGLSSLEFDDDEDTISYAMTKRLNDKCKRSNGRMGRSPKNDRAISSAILKLAKVIQEREKKREEFERGIFDELKKTRESFDKMIEHLKNR